MNVTVNQEYLANALTAVGRSVSSRSTLPVLSNILLTAQGGTLALSATNLEIGTRVWVSAVVAKPGAITVPARLLTEFVTSLKGATSIQLSVNPKTQTLTLKTGTATANLKGIDAAEFPLIPSMPGSFDPAPDQAITINLPTANLAGLIERAAMAASNDESRPTLTGIETTFAPAKLQLAATDGFRLSVQTAAIDLTVAEPIKVIVPANSLAELARLSKDAAQDQDARLQITTARNQVLCALAGDKKWLRAELAMQLIDAKFPDWRAIVPTGTTTTAVVNAAELRKAFTLAKLFARDNAFITRLTVAPQANTLTVQAISADTGSTTTTLDAMIEGQDVDIAFNAKYVHEFLSQLQTPETKLELTGDARPGVFLAVGIPAEEQLVVIMPINKSAVTKATATAAASPAVVERTPVPAEPVPA